MSRIIPVIMVSKSLIERLEKARAGLVQRRTWVNNSPSTKGHYRMQWVALGPAVAKEKDYSKQIDLFGEPRQGAAGAVFGDQDLSEKDRRHAEEIEAANRYNESPEGKADAKRQRFELLAEKIAKDYPDKPAPKAGLEDVRKMSDDALDAEHLKLFPKFNEVQKLKGYRYQEDHEKVMPYSDYQRMRDVMNEMLRRSEIERENLKEYPGLTKDETWFIISTKKMIDKMKKQNGGEISPEKLKDMSHMINWMRKLESKIREPEKPAEKPVAEAPATADGLFGGDVMDRRNTVDFKPTKGSLSRASKFFEIMGKRYKGEEFPDRAFDNIFEMNDGDEVVVSIAREMKENPGKATAIIQSGNFERAPSILQPTILKNAGRNTPEIVSQFRDIYSSSRKWLNEMPGRMKERAKEAKYQELKDIAEFAADMYQKTVDKIDGIAGKEEKPSVGKVGARMTGYPEPVESAKPAASGDNKAYPGLTNDEIMELITSRNTLGLMEKQYKGSVAPRVKREMSALQDRIRGLESKIREPEKSAGEKNVDAYSKAKNFLADKGFIRLGPEKYLSGNIYSLPESLRQSGVLTPTDEKEMAVEFLTSGIKGIDRFARLNGRMPRDDSYRKKKYKKLLTEIRSGGDVPIDIMKEAVHDAARDFAGIKDRFDKDENESNKRLAIMLSKVISRHLEKGEGLADGGGYKEYLSGGKKPFEEMTFKERNKPGLPENVAETVRDVLGVSSGTAANYAGSNKYDDIDKFKYAAAKWAYENDKVGSASDILDQYARHKGIRKSILDTFRDGLAKAFGGR